MKKNFFPILVGNRNYRILMHIVSINIHMKKKKNETTKTEV